MSYDRVPPDFMKGVFIEPHNFSDPENPEHAKYLDSQLKYDMYNSAIFRISGCEFSFLGKEEEELKVEKMEKCEGADPIWGLSNYIGNKKNETDSILSCEDWSISRTMQGQGRVRSQYRVKIYQTERDLFYPEIHPPSLLKLLKLYMLG